jgi:hypothetical protein
LIINNLTEIFNQEVVSGKPVSVRFGRYGAFAQIGHKDDEEKPVFDLYPYSNVKVYTCILPTSSSTQIFLGSPDQL